MSRPQFVSHSEEYECILCRDMLLDAVAPECGHRFCKSCMDSHLEQLAGNPSIPVTCPSKDDSCPEIVNGAVFPDFSTRREMQSLHVYCTFQQYGCQDTMEWKVLSKHITECSHRNDIECAFAQHGCDFKGTQEEVDQHRISQKHVHDQAVRVTDLSDKVTSLGSELDRLKGQLVGQTQTSPSVKKPSDLDFSEPRVRTELSRILTSLGTATQYGTLVWRIDDYMQLKRDAIQGSNHSIYSQPFYTHQFGYKICARFYPNGDGAARGQHASLFIVVMRGEYDAVLPWPLSKNVTFTLLPQEPYVGSGDHTVSFATDPSSSSFTRPHEDMNKASGMPQFIRQELLDTRQFLGAEGALFLKISVQ